ncbi:MAG: hypothetical protein DRZ79_02575 [Candidatus Cloacimonadota bacterium]|nr:MAG: hypothetical protein DRZ79_02575 [Candidatus Cloacimonadota bacterium]
MFMILQINREKYLDDVLMALAEIGVEDPIVLAGESLGHKLAFDMPLFAGFRQTLGREKNYTKIIMATVQEEDVDFMLEELKSAGVDFHEDEIGKIFLLPIEKIIE